MSPNFCKTRKLTSRRNFPYIESNHVILILSGLSDGFSTRIIAYMDILFTQDNSYKCGSHKYRMHSNA